MDFAPVSAEVIERVYGLDARTAACLWLNTFDVHFAPDLYQVTVTFTFSLRSIPEASRQIADLLAGLPGLIRLRFYSSVGVLGHKSVQSMPDLIGLINGVTHGEQFVFRLPIEGQEAAFGRGEPVKTCLWVCVAGVENLLDSYKVRGGFEQWKADNCLPLSFASADPEYSVLHCDCGLTLTAERLHSLATLPEVTAIINLEGTKAFK